MPTAHMHAERDDEQDAAETLARPSRPYEDGYA